MIDGIITFFELLFGILENPKILLFIIPICIIVYLFAVYF